MCQNEEQNFHQNNLNFTRIYTLKDVFLAQFCKTEDFSVVSKQQYDKNTTVHKKRAPVSYRQVIRGRQYSLLKRCSKHLGLYSNCEIKP